MFKSILIHNKFKYFLTKKIKWTYPNITKTHTQQSISFANFYTTLDTHIDYYIIFNLIKKYISLPHYTINLDDTIHIYILFQANDIKYNLKNTHILNKKRFNTIISKPNDYNNVSFTDKFQFTQENKYFYKILFTVTDDNSNNFLVTKVGYTKYPNLRFRDLTNEYNTDYINVEYIYTIPDIKVELEFHKENKNSTHRHQKMFINNKYRKELYIPSKEFTDIFIQFTTEKKLKRIYP